MKYPEEIKQEVFKRLNDGDKVKQISEDMGISLATIYGWKKKFGNAIGEKTNANEVVDKAISEDEKDQFTAKYFGGTSPNDESQDDEHNSNATNSQNSQSRIQGNQQRRDFYQEIRYTPQSVVANPTTVTNFGEGIENENQSLQQKRKASILKYLNKKKEDIYLKMQSKDPSIQAEGITQWDKMEVLIEKVENDVANEDILYKKIQILQVAETRIMNRKEKEEIMSQINNTTETDTDR